MKVGIFHTDDEAQACRVLAGLHAKGLPGCYSYEGGWFDIFTECGEEEGALELSLWAHTIANTNLVPLHLGAFQPCQER